MINSRLGKGLVSKKLSEYERKRNRKQTPEPYGGRRGKAKEPIFVVQRHDARRLHYDFRLERDGVLASLGGAQGRPARAGPAAPRRPCRGPSTRVRELRGRDPEGELRRGHRRDLGPRHVRAPRGEARRRPHRAAARRAARGAWALVPAHLSGDEKNWLLLRKREDGDGAARSRVYRPMLATLTEELPRATGSSSRNGTVTARSPTSAAARRSSSRAEATT